MAKRPRLGRQRRDRGGPAASRVLDGRAGGDVRRKRRTKYHWLYNTGSTGPTADTEDTTSGLDWVLTVPVNGTTTIQIQDLVMDRPSDDILNQLGTGVATMGMVNNNDYFIKRIVGKWLLAIQQNNDGAANGRAGSALVTAGMFVARAGDEDDGAGAENFPIQAFAAAGAINNYSPLRPENIREPWIWRRTWLLGNRAQEPAANPGFHFPESNTEYGSIQDGAHVDAKTARRVRDGERLFGVLVARNWPLNDVSTNTNVIRGHFDYRVLGAGRRSRNRSAF